MKILKNFLNKTKNFNSFNKLFVVFMFTLILTLSSGSYSVLADHDSVAELQPEWSASGETMDYTVEITNNGPDVIDEVRIYNNENYENFDCENKTGWELYYISVLDACFYVENGDTIPDGESDVFEFSAMTSVDPEDTCQLEWKFETRDENEEWKFIYDYTSIDSKKPELDKQVGEPFINCTLNPEHCDGDYDGWVTQDTIITIQVNDDFPETNCDSGITYCYSTIKLDGDVIESITYGNGDPVMQMGWEVDFDEDSNHELNITCVDLAGNIMEDIETFKVDDKEPETDKDFSEPMKIDGLVEWIDTFTEITFDPVDPDHTGEGCAIGVDKTWYRNDLANELVMVGENSEELCYQPDQYCNEGELGFVETPYEQEAYDGCIDYWQVWCQDNWDSEYSSWEQCVEENVHGMWDPPGMLGCMVYEEWKLWDGNPIQKPDESCHVLQYFSVDHLGNIEDTQYNCFFVDKTIPKLEKTHDESAVEDEDMDSFPETDGIFHWVNYDTDIDFKCEDQDPHPSGDERVCFKISFDGDEPWLTEEYCADYYPEGEILDLDPGCGEQCKYCCVDVDGNNEFVFNFYEESMHDLHYFCEDAVWKGRPGHGIDEPHLQYYRVDNTPPNITKTMLGDEGMEWIGDCPPQSPSDECYVKGGSGVHVDVTDPDTTGMGCASDDVYCEYEVWWEGSVIDEGDFGEEGIDIIFDEDSEHILKINCWDALDNEMGMDEETFLVDMEPPETTKMYGEPYKIEPGCAQGCIDFCMGEVPEDDWDECIHDCQHERCTWWINSSTEVSLSAEDEKVGTKETYWRNLYFPENHEMCYHENIVPVGDVEVQVIEDSCHPDYYTGLDDYDDSVEWNNYSETGPFTKSPESCHVIEYYSVDEFGNEEPLRWQCVFVDNTGPEAIKEVGEPKIPCTPPVTTTTVDTTTTIITEPICVGTPNNEACNAYDESQCVAIPGCSWLPGTDCAGYTSGGQGMCESFPGCEWCPVENVCTGTTGETCTGTPESCEAAASNWPSDPEAKCLETSGCDWIMPLTGEYREEGDTFEGPLTAPLGNGICSGATQTSQCAYVASNSLPPYAYDTLVAQGADPSLLDQGCGDILILSSGNPLDSDTHISTGMNNPGCGPGGAETNPDGQPTHDCVDLTYSPSGDSVVLAVSSEWPEYYESITDWMRIGGIVDVSINDWEPDVNPDDGVPDQPYQDVVDIPYTPSISGTITLATLGQGQQVDLRVADSLDYIYDTAMIVVPLSCYEEGPEPILCGNGEVEPGEECDDGNQQNGDGCSAQCLIEDEGLPECWWVRDDNFQEGTPILLDCDDSWNGTADHPVDQEWGCFRVSFDEEPWLTEEYCQEASDAGRTVKMPATEDDWCCIYFGEEEPYIFSFHEDSVHDLEFYCVDHLKNKGPLDFEWFRVDSTAPNVTKVLSEPYYGECPPEPDSEDECYVDTATEITLDIEDGGPICAVGDVECRWRYRVMPGLENGFEPLKVTPTLWSQWFNYTEEEPIIFPEECYHELQIECWDALGNMWTDEEYFIVDKTPPEITKEYGEPKHKGYGPGEEETETRTMGSKGWGGNYFDFTEVWECEGDDYFGWNPIKVDRIYHENCDTEFVIEAPTSGIENAPGNFWVEIDVDNSGDKSPGDWQFSWHEDETERVPTDSHWGYRYIKPDSSWSDWQEPLPDWLEFSKSGETFHVMVDSDYLGNKNGMKDDCGLGYGFALFMVIPDEGFPQGVCDPGNSWPGEAVIIPVQSDGYFVEGILGSPIWWINSNTLINVSAVDPEPHPSGLKELNYRFDMVDDRYCNGTWDCEDAEVEEGVSWKTYTGEFNIPEESCHLIEINAKDNVDKESYHKQCVFVDTSDPVTNKTVGIPKSPWDGMGAYEGEYQEAEDYCTAPGLCWRITEMTPIFLNCEDPDPHPSNHAQIYYRTWWDNTGNWTDWSTVPEGSAIYLNGECFHKLEYYCVDAVNNTGEPDLEYFKVEGSRFEIPIFKKWNLISVPFELFDSDPEEVFKDTPNVQSVWAYDPDDEMCTDLWCVWTPDGIENDNLKVWSGWGYWVRASEEDMLVIGGDMIKPKEEVPQRTLRAGWNLIGPYDWWYNTTKDMRINVWDGSTYTRMDHEDVCGYEWPTDLYWDYGHEYLSVIDNEYMSVYGYINCISESEPIQGSNEMYAGRGYWVFLQQPYDGWFYGPSSHWNDFWKIPGPIGPIVA